MTTSRIRGAEYALGYGLSVARGSVPGAEPFSGYGEHVSAGAASGVLWPNGPWAIPPATGLAMTFVSTSDQDKAGGTGIYALHVHYLDVNLAPQEKTITLNGLTSVVDTTLMRFIQCMHIVSGAYGSGKAAAGVISASNGAQVYSQVSVGSVRCSSSARMVPAGKRLIIDAAVGGSASGSAAASVIVRLGASKFATHDYTNDSILIPQAAACVQDDSVSISLPTPLAAEAGTVVGMTFQTDKAATITGSWFGVLEDS